MLMIANLDEKHIFLAVNHGDFLFTSCLGPFLALKQKNIMKKYSGSCQFLPDYYTMENSTIDN